MPPRVDGTNNNNQEFFKLPEPPPEPPKVEPRVLSEADRNLMMRQNSLSGDMLRVGLANQFQAQVALAPQDAPQAPPAADNGEIVRSAVESIQKSLSEGFFTDWDVSHSDLSSIQNKFNELDPVQSNAVFDNLTEADLKKWSSELNGMLGSYSREEKQQLFDELAGKLNGANLAQFAEALGLGVESTSVRPGQKNQPDVHMLADAVARSASPEVKAEFVKALAAKADKHQDAGVAIVQVLNSMKESPALLQQTLKDIDAQLPAIIDGAAQKTVVSTRNGTVTNYDPEPLAQLLDTFSTLNGEGSATQKARIFELAANKITEIRSNATVANIVPLIGSSLYHGQPAEDLIRNGLTKIIDSDTTGVVRELEQNRNSFSGSGATAYLKSMLGNGEQAKVGTFIDRLMRGNDLSGNAYDRFGQADGNIHQNAQSLGFFTGATAASVKQITGDRTKQADIIKNIFGSIAGGVGAINTPTGVGAAAVNGITNQLINDAVDSLNRGTTDAGRALEDLTYPTNPQTGKIYGADPNEQEQPETVYKSNFSWVYNHN